MFRAFWGLFSGTGLWCVPDGVGIRLLLRVFLGPFLWCKGGNRCEWRVLLGYGAAGVQHFVNPDSYHSTTTSSPVFVTRVVL